ncbi:MAG: ATP-binding cassette domain-containing protein [Proteobacteria bacterium]|nr:ATP-binding cassette domain-containing protein [Pseudomonadota bacterium]
MLELKAISKTFGNRAVLRSVSLTLNRGQICFVLGRSGVGKSVLLKTIVGLIPQDSGEVWIQSEKTDPQNEEQMVSVRQKCGLVFQMPALLDSLTLQENLEFGLKPEKLARLGKYLDWVQLSRERLSRYPAEVSFGTQKKASVVRTLLREPQFILFDEPTTGLDPVSRQVTNQMIRNVVKESHSGCIVVSHDVQSAIELASTIILLDQGQVIFQGTPESFCSSEQPLARAFCNGMVLLDH